MYQETKVLKKAVVVTKNDERMMKRRHGKQKPLPPKQTEQREVIGSADYDELYDALYEAYARHFDSQHIEPDRIADVAIVDRALEESGVEMEFQDAMDYYRTVEGRLYREYKENMSGDVK